MGFAFLRRCCLFYNSLLLIIRLNYLTDNSLIFFESPYRQKGFAIFFPVVLHNWETRNAYRILVGNPEGKRLLGRPRRRWVDNIKMDLREIGWDGMD
jgi:hypothetical protein